MAGIPAVAQPVSPALRLVADRSQPEDARLKPLVDGTVVLVKEPQDVALIRRILRDPDEGDTIRNEAANLLNRSEVLELAADLQAVLKHPAEQARFRSFAAQHLGVIWRQDGGEDEDLRKMLHSLLSDRHIEVRREALWPLAQEGDPVALATAKQLIADPSTTGIHDLCCRIAALRKMSDLLPPIRRLAVEVAPGAFAVLAAADPVGPFGFSGRTYDPANPASWTIARDGTIESATQLSGDAEAGNIAVALWAGDNQAGGRGAGGINLFGPANQNAWIGLDKSWRIGEGVDGNGLWIYYTKFQQDALIVMGFIDCDAADLPTDHGAGFALEGMQPWNRVLLVLPWRWVQGGGSAYQTGSYGGNPPEAGVWAVPAGMSLEDAAKQAGTYRLSGLDALLKEIQPHLWSSSYKLQLTAIGGWEVQVDIDNDGQVDHRTHGAAGGNLPNPFAGMDERSGLIISSRSAMGNHSSTVGRTDYTLSYRIASIESGGGLNASFYDFDTNLHAIPDVSGLTPDVTRIDPVVDYPKTSGTWPGLPPSMENTFASRHSGWLKVDTVGSHVLELESDDGSRLLLGDDEVVSNDGLHGMKKKSGTRDLAATMHPILVDYFENGGQAGLIMRRTPPGTTTPVVVPSSNLFHGPTYDPVQVDRRPFSVSLHAQVKSSPTIIDGKSWGAGYEVTAASPTLGPDPVPTAWINEGTNTFDEEPNFGQDPPPAQAGEGGWGMGQLTNPVPTKQMAWNWQANLTEAAARMRAAQQAGEEWIASQVAEQQIEAPAKLLANESFTFGEVTYKSGTARLPSHAVSIKIYNGAPRHAIAWDREGRNDETGVWSKLDSPYVDTISNTWGEP